MEFNNFAGRIKSLVNFDTFQKPSAEYKEVSHFTVFQGEMVRKTVQKTKFSQSNARDFISQMVLFLFHMVTRI